eukprot:7950260-Alexandrium_andersonii.AAC.1
MCIRDSPSAPTPPHPPRLAPRAQAGGANWRGLGGGSREQREVRRAAAPPGQAREPAGNRRNTYSIDAVARMA